MPTNDTSNPNGTDPVTLVDLPTLGHAVCLGELYDQRTGEFLGVQLYPQEKIDCNHSVTDVRNTKLTLDISNTLEDKQLLLDISAELSLSVLSGLVKVSGSAAYLNDSKSNTQAQAFAMALKMRLKEKRLLFAEDDLGENILRFVHEKYAGKATHFVSAIVYGGNFIVNLAARQSKLSEEEQIEGQLEVELGILKGVVDLKAKASAEIKAKFEKLNDKFDLTMYGDVALEKVPINPQDVLDDFPDAANMISEGGGVPISVMLQPIPKGVGKIYDLDADCVDTIFRAFSSLDDLRSRFSVLVERIKLFRELVPGLEQVIRKVASAFIREHTRLLHDLQTFLYNYKHGKRPDNDGACGMGEEVLKTALELHQRHLDPDLKNDQTDQYPISLAGLEKEFTKFENLVSDMEKMWKSLPAPSPTGLTRGDEHRPIYFSTLDDVSRAPRLQNKISLFIMTPLTSSSDAASDSDSIRMFLAIIRKYAAYLNDTSIPAYILYAEDLKRLENRLPNKGEFSGLKNPSLSIGQVHTGGMLLWSRVYPDPKPTGPSPLPFLSFYHEALASDRLYIKILPLDGKISFSFLIHAKSGMGKDKKICALSSGLGGFRLEFLAPLKAEIKNYSTIAEIISNKLPPLGEPFTATFIQDVKDCKWSLYLGHEKVGEAEFSSPPFNYNMLLYYPKGEPWWDGEVYKMKAFQYALSPEEVAVAVSDMESTTN